MSCPAESRKAEEQKKEKLLEAKEEIIRLKSELDKEVKDYVFSFKESEELLQKLIGLLDFLNPLYNREGKSQIFFAIGCTGGNHRSVAIAEALKDHFESRWDNVTVHHRDINRG